MDEQNLLAAIAQMMDERLDRALEPIKADINDLKAGQTAMQTDITDIKERVVKIEVTQENILCRQVQTLDEGHSLVVDKLKALDPLAEKVEDVQNTVDVLKHITVKR